MMNPEQVRPVRLLMVCTANQCRSPMAEAMAIQWFQRRGMTAEVSSAGVSAYDAPATPTIVTVARSRGLDLTGHRARPAEPELIRAADVVIAMDNGHVLELAGRAPECQPWIATLPELAEAARTEPLPSPAPDVDGAAVRDWVGRNRAPLGDLLGGRLDIADPVGRPRAAHERTADLIEGDLTDVLTSWFGPAPPEHSPSDGPDTRGKRWGRKQTR